MRIADDLNVLLANQIKDGELVLGVSEVAFVNIRTMLSLLEVLCQLVTPLFKTLQISISLFFAPLPLRIAADIF